ncbi:MAG TPA: CHAT domain-containing tetratricopeptide repeat protein [Myxococcaceae bacterium]
MRRVLGWTVVVILCGAADAGIQDAGMDAQLVEAQAAFDEAQKFLDAGQYAAAMPLGERAIALREAVLGGMHPDVANSLRLVGELCILRADFTRAELLLQRALAIHEAALGKSHPDVAETLNDLALLAHNDGRPDQAEALYLRSLAIWEAALGKSHPDVANSLNNLAALYQIRGLYSRAEPLFVRSLAIREAAFGKSHPDVAQSLNNLAFLYYNQGLYNQAEPLFVRSLAIWEAALGKNHPYVATSLNNLARVYQGQGLYSRAEPLLLRSLAIRELSLGKSHPNSVESLNNLAELYQDWGMYDRAEPIYLRVLSVEEAAVSKSPFLVAASLNNLARLYQAQGLYNRAEPLFLRSLAMREVYRGKNHPIIATSLNNLALLHLGRHRLADALPLFTRAFTLSEERLRLEALGFSGSRLARFLEFLRSDEERLYTILRAHPGDASVRRLALTAALLLKGRSIEEITDTSRTIYRSLGAQDREVFERLRSLRTQLAKLSLDGPGKLTPTEYQQRLKDFADQGDILEADLAKRSAPLRALTALPPPAEMVDRVSASLPKDGALLELIAYAEKPLIPKPGTPHSKIPSHLRYLALVLFPDGHTRALDLGPAAPIDSAASRFHDALANRDVGYQRAAQRLYTLAFQPLLPLLGEVRRVFLAPDGQLALVPFAALHDGRRFLVDTFDFTYLTSGKDLLPRPEDIPPSRSVVVIADPDFGTPPAAPPSSPNGAVTLAARSSSLERFFSMLRADVADQPWVPLPGTRQEAEALQRLLPQAQLLMGPDASKERLLNLAAPGILHIATHGFFLDDAAASPGTRGLGVSEPPGGGSPAQRPPDPLLRSGLVLAGARAPAAKAGDTSTRHLDESLVTALELAGLNLWGTELVVLSACDTGRGDVKLGQGVYGLRRALVATGAETLVMSLWKVNDETTRTLMEIYYRNLLAGKGRVTALREAMLALREKQPHPHFWAPFIALGRDAPLRGVTPLAP